MCRTTRGMRPWFAGGSMPVSTTATLTRPLRVPAMPGRRYAALRVGCDVDFASQQLVDVAEERVRTVAEVTALAHGRGCPFVGGPVDRREGVPLHRFLYRHRRRSCLGVCDL